MKKIFILLSMAVLISSSCKKFLEIPFPQGQVSSAETFADDSTAVSAVNGLYSQLMAGAAIFLNGSVTIYPGLSADELYNTSANNTNDQFYTNSLSAEESSQVYSGLWKWGYTNIFHCNSIIEGLTATHGVSDRIKGQLMGEAYSIRALCYFYLVNLYGDIPLQLSTDYKINSTMPRTGTELVYEQIITDLKAGVDLMSETYPTGSRTRFNRSAANALLSRVYLYQQQYQLAEETATGLIGQAGTYGLVSDLSKVFLLGSKETILALYPASIAQNAGEGFSFNPATTASARPTFAFTPGLLNDFETNDKRRIAWVASKTVAGQTFYYPFKYRIKNDAVVTEANVIFRLAEQLLIRAEARARTNNLSGALEDLNIIRQRAGLPVINSMLLEDVLKAILHERRIELMAEKGHRWLDLKRTGEIDQVLSLTKPGWSSTDALYPIPQQDIEKNPFLKQNPGY